MSQRGATLRELLSRGEAVPVPGCHDAFGARLIADAGFPAVYMGGYSVSASFGKPDTGRVTMTDMVARASQIVDAIDLPVIADADTGYGGTANVADCVVAFEKAGVSAIHLEDQIIPKRCGAMAGKALVPVEEMTLRLTAARKARRHDDFLIFGRTDAMTLFGLDECIIRARAMEAAGADGILVPSLTTHDELSAITDAVSVPVIHLMAETIRPVFSLEELTRCGYAMAIYAISLIQASAQAQKQVLDTLASTGTTAASVPFMMPSRDINRLVGADTQAAFEQSLIAGG